MDNHDSHEINFEAKSWRVYLMSAVLAAGSLMQWLLLVNFECFDFLLNYWLLFGACITFLLIIIVCITTDLYQKTLPTPLRWIFALSIIEILNIALGFTVIRVNHLQLYCSLAAVLISLILLLAIGRTTKLDHLPVIALVVFNCNTLLIILLFILMMVEKFLAEFYTYVFLTISAFCYVILVLNTIYISMLIQYYRYEIQWRTNGLKLALYIHFVFDAFVWLSLSLVVEINKIRDSILKNLW